VAGVLPTCPPIWLCTAERVGPVESRIPIQGPKGQYQPCLGGWSSLRGQCSAAAPVPSGPVSRGHSAGCRSRHHRETECGAYQKGRQCFSQWQITVISIVFTIGKGHGIVKNSSCVLSTELFWGIVFYIMCGILLCLGITVSGMYLHHMNLIL